MNSRDWIWFILAWLFLIFLVNPIGEFPLNDDWGYAKVVQHLIETGEYRPGTWPVMTLFTQVWWGAAFAKVFGFSFTILRISTLVLAILGSYWVYRACLNLHEDRFWARVALVTLALNPLYFHLSFTFMTDVPYTVGVLGAILLYRRAMDTEGVGYWVLAILATAAATLIRQPAILLAPAFGLALIIHQPKWRSVLLAVGGILFTYGILLGYVYFLGQQGETPGAPDSLGPLFRRLRFPLFGELLLKRGGMILFYLSVFLLPLLVLNTAADRWQLRSRREILAAVLAIGITLLFAVQSWHEIPAGNIIEFLGLGPTPLLGRDSRQFSVAAIPDFFWSLLKSGGYLALFLLFRTLFLRLSGKTFQRHWDKRQYWTLGLVFFSLAFGLFLLLERSFFDRYLLVLLPVLIFIAAPSRSLKYPVWAKVLSLTFLVLMSVFSIGACREYLNWNRVRWTVLNSLTEKQHIPHGQIDGGLEFNGWYETHPQNPFSFENKSWWMVNEDQYVLSFSKEISCSVNSTPYPVRSWWPAPDTLYVHERGKLVSRDTIFCDLEQLSADSSSLVSTAPGYTFSGVEQRIEGESHSGSFAFFLTPEHPYGGMLRLSPVKPCEAITISAWRLGNNGSAGIVAAAPNVDDYHTFQNRFEENTQPGGWHRIRHEIRLPADYSSDRLDIYLWNPVNDSIWMDDMQVIWRRMEEK